MSALTSFAAVVPSLGRSPHLREALAALRRELATLGGVLVWVQQGELPPPELARGSERLVELPRPAGFAAAANTGIREALRWGNPEAIALVNDDLLLEPGWFAALAAELAARPRAGAVQGVNLDLARPELADGWGLAWNQAFQAVQLGHGEPALAPDTPAFEIFGVSATAAVYRTAALASAASRSEAHASVTGARGAPLASGAPAIAPFDESLESYYEDAQLAVDLRAAGWESWCVPRARARHAGQATSGRHSLTHHRLVTRNRWLVAAGLLGEKYPRARPFLLDRDLRDLARALLTLDAQRVAGLVAGWSGARAVLRQRPPAAAPSKALAAARRLAAPSPGSRANR